MTTGQTIAELRREKGLTQRQLAHAINVTQSIIAQWEKNKIEPNSTSLRLLASVFDVTTDYILGITNDYAPARQSIITNNSNGVIIGGNMGNIKGNINYTYNGSPPSEPQRITKCPECKALKKQLATIKKIIESPKQE
ncbi:MAG: helix-turn-helix domain-containing protein [Firmicutes bacterium]|nr:helix-turn-helix domain-containing protein [Bacillota bacterium]